MHSPVYATTFFMFALPISMPRFKSINFYQKKPKIKLFSEKKMQNFWALGAQTPEPFPHCKFLATLLVEAMLKLDLALAIYKFMVILVFRHFGGAAFSAVGWNSSAESCC